MPFNQYTIQDFLNEPQKRIHFHIDRLEDQFELPKNIVSPHKHLFHEIFFVEAGEIFHIVDFKEINAGKNTLSFITQGQLHFRGENKGAIKGFRLMFDTDFFWALQPYHQFLFDMVYFGNVYHSPYLELKSYQLTTFQFYFNNLFNEYQSNQKSELALGSNLFLLLLEIQRVLDTKDTKLPKDQNDLQLYRQFAEVLEKNFKNNWSVNDYSVALQVSASKLSKTIHNLTNDSILNIIQKRLILEAKRLLTFHDLTIGEISYTLGISDSSYFARFFKKLEGVSPKEFRIASLKKYRTSNELS